MSAGATTAGPGAPTAPQVAGIAAAALVAGVAVSALVLASDHFADRAVWAVFGPLAGWGFVATGLYAWRRRPESRFGALLIALGFAWLLGPLPAAEAPAVFTLGIVLGSLWGPLLAHALLSFPTGRLPTRRQRALVIAGYIVVPLAPAPALLLTDADDLVDCEGACPENVVQVGRDQELANALLAVSSAVVMTLVLIVVWILIARWRAAGPAERRSLAPLFVAGATTLLFVVGYIATQAPALLWLALAAFAATPLAFLAGLLRADVAQSRGMRRLMARLADRSERADLRDALAGALGDPALRLAFWVGEQDGYVDAAGAPLELPTADDPRVAVTEIARDGRRVAAIVHDRTLVENAETVRAAGAATLLALENQRLEAELRARIVELRASRARIVQAADTERRRLERNLHDGAQSRLLALALNLRLARGGFEEDSPAAALVDASIGEVRASLDELRELARGIHPAILSERGLEPALRALAARAPLPVEVVGAPGGPLPAAVETAAYFVASEALANVAKYARAEHATVRLQRVSGQLLLEVSDDGVGGASASAGTGLRGLSDRVGALDGTLEVVSPPGRGTLLRARLPCA